MHQLMFFTQSNILFFCLFFGIGKCSAAAHIEENSSKHNESRMDITGKQKEYYVYCILKKCTGLFCQKISPNCQQEKLFMSLTNSSLRHRAAEQ